MPTPDTVDASLLDEQCRMVLEPFAPGSDVTPTVWMILRHVSRRETSWIVDICVIRDNQPRVLRAIARAANVGIDRERGGFVINTDAQDLAGRRLWSKVAEAVTTWAEENNAAHPPDLYSAYVIRWL